MKSSEHISLTFCDFISNDCAKILNLLTVSLVLQKNYILFEEIITKLWIQNTAGCLEEQKPAPVPQFAIAHGVSSSIHPSLHLSVSLFSSALISFFTLHFKMFYLAKFLHFFLSYYLDFPATVLFSNLNTFCSKYGLPVSGPTFLRFLLSSPPFMTSQGPVEVQRAVCFASSVCVHKNQIFMRSLRIEQQQMMSVSKLKKKKRAPSFHGNLHHPFPSPLVFCVHVGSRRRDAGITESIARRERDERKKEDSWVFVFLSSYAPTPLLKHKETISRDYMLHKGF